jgi:hypothetical protein
MLSSVGKRRMVFLFSGKKKPPKKSLILGKVKSPSVLEEIIQLLGMGQNQGKK